MQLNIFVWSEIKISPVNSNYNFTAYVNTLKNGYFGGKKRGHSKC